MLSRSVATNSFEFTPPGPTFSFTLFFSHVGQNPLDRPPVASLLHELMRAAGRASEGAGTSPIDQLVASGGLLLRGLARKVRGEE